MGGGECYGCAAGVAVSFPAPLGRGSRSCPPGLGDVRAPGPAEPGRAANARPALPSPDGQSPQPLGGPQAGAARGRANRGRPRPAPETGAAPAARPGPAPGTHLPAAGAPDGGRPVVDVALDHRAAHVHPQQVARRGGPAVGLPARHRPARSGD